MTTKIMSVIMWLYSKIELNGGDYMEDIRDNLKSVIEYRGVKQANVAKKANMTPAKLSSIVNKNRKLEANEMFSLCDVLDITPQELRKWTNDNRAS